MVRDRPGGQTGDREENASRLAPARLGPVPAVARLPRPVRVLGRRRRSRTARSVGPHATGLVGPAAAVGIDHTEAPSVRIAWPRCVTWPARASRNFWLPGSFGTVLWASSLPVVVLAGFTSIRSQS